MTSGPLGECTPREGIQVWESLFESPLKLLTHCLTACVYLSPCVVGFLLLATWGSDGFF